MNIKRTIYIVLCIVLSRSATRLTASEHSLITLENQKPSLEFLFSSTLEKKDHKKTKQLLQQGADPNIKQYSQNSLLHSIIEQSNSSDTTLIFTQLLCSHNVNIDSKNSCKETPLMLAIKKNDERLVELLLQNNARPNIENYYGEYPIHIAMEWDTEPHFYKKRFFLPNIVKLLLKYKADTNAPYRFKNARPLHAAVFHNSLEIVRELLRYGANKNMYDDRGYTPLSLAKLYQYKEIIAILSQNSPPAQFAVIEKEIESFHIIEIKKAPLKINCSQPFSCKIVIDDYLSLIDNTTQ